MYYLISLFIFMFSGISQAGELWTKYDISDSVTSITGYGNYIWAGTIKGLVRVNRTDGSIKKFTKADGLPSNNVRSLCADDNGIIYAGLRDNERDLDYNIKSYIISIYGDSIIDYTKDSMLRDSSLFVLSADYYEDIPFLIHFKNDIYLSVNIKQSPGNYKKYRIAVIRLNNGNGQIVWTKTAVADVSNLSNIIYIYNMFINPITISIPFTIITEEGKGKQKKSVYDKEGKWNIYYGLKQTDYIVDSDTTRYTPDNSGLTGIVNTIAIDNNYTKWIGCYGSSKIISYDNTKWQEYRANDWNNTTEIKDIVPVDDNCILVATNNPIGFYRLNPNYTTEVENQQVKSPLTFSLSTAFPNPFNASTTISFTLNKPEKVNLAVYSLAGQKVRELAAGNYSAGSHTAVWDGKDDSGNAVSSGVYLARMESGGVSKVVRMAMVK